MPGLENVDVNWQEAMPEMQWTVNRVEAAQLGVSFQDIANTINTATNGTIASYYQENGFEYPIVVQFPLAQSQNRGGDVRHPHHAEHSLVTPGRSGASSARWRRRSMASGPAKSRASTANAISPSPAPAGTLLGSVQNDIQRAMTGLRLPAGYYWAWGLNQQRTAQEFSGMGWRWCWPSV